MSSQVTLTLWWWQPPPSLMNKLPNPQGNEFRLCQKDHLFGGRGASGGGGWIWEIHANILRSLPVALDSSDTSDSGDTRLLWLE